MTEAKLSPIQSVASTQHQTPHITPPHSSELPFDHGKAWTSFEKFGVPVNKFINKVGSEAFWPTGLEEESEKAARVLRSFCRDGVPRQNTNAEAPLPNTQPVPKPVSKHELSLDTNIPSDTTPLIRDDLEEQRPPLPPRGPRKTSPALLKIPTEVIHNAWGLAIFTTFRVGTWGASLAAGSGVLIARDVNTRQWSSPSAIGVSTLGLGFLTGIDVTDCVIVINTFEALEKFNNMRLSLGAEVALTAGPWGAGRAMEYTLGKHTQTSGRIARNPTYTYIKSRGIYAGLQLDGTVIGVRSDENAKFYGERVGVDDILTGKAQRWTELQGVLREIDSTRGMDSAGDMQVAREQLTHAPVLLEFVDRRGQKKGSDGVWYKDDNEKAKEVEREPSLRSVKQDQLFEADKKEKLDYEMVDRYA